MNAAVLYRDASLIVCEKPVGIPSESPGLPELITSQTCRNVWPVHRLDQGTGGAIVLAFSPEVNASMQRLFQHSKVKKEYLAVVSGSLSESSGTWKDYLWHDHKCNKSFVVSRQRKNVKEAVCAWRLIDTAAIDHQLLSLVRISLHTGRTHQIRVQFGSRGYPLVGDRKYGSRIMSETIALWSAALVFPHPDQKSGTVSVTSVPPSVFPWNLFSCLL